MKILIAEDEQRAREGLCDLIRSIGEEYTVVGKAANGRQALEMMRLTQPDVVFTDIKMPYVSGLELITAAKEQNYKTHFVVVSAYAEFDYAKQALKLGVEDYLLKPPTKQEVLKTLQNLERKMKYGDQPHYGVDAKLPDQYPNAHPLVKEVLRQIEAGYADKLNQQEIAQQLSVSPEYLSYLFAREIGKPFSKFVKEYRIRKAVDLLKSRSATIQDVPYQVGFADRKYFDKVFTEVMGESPSVFKKSM
ncbi:MAG TPA: response regulator [Lachnospiraceae bacterium]|nr:response regulator [Lachnospiraceae bacterium]